MRLLLCSLLVIAMAGFAESAAKTKINVPKIDETSLRDRASEELHPKEQTDETPTPSVMLPLRDSYIPNRGRSWDWSFESRITSHSIFGGKPSHGYGLANLQDLGPFTLFGLGAGFEKSLWGSHLGLNLIGEVSNRKADYTAPTGLGMPVQIQYFAYGLEPRWSYIFNSWLGATASVMVQSVIISHSGLDSAMATWTVQYLERAPRLAADFYLSQAEDSRQRVSLAWANHVSEFGQAQSWSIAYGATW